MLTFNVLCEVLSFLTAVECCALLSCCKYLQQFRFVPECDLRISPYKTYYKKKKWLHGAIRAAELHNMPQFRFFAQFLSCYEEVEWCLRFCYGCTEAVLHLVEEKNYPLCKVEATTALRTGKGNLVLVRYLIKKNCISQDSEKLFKYACGNVEAMSLFKLPGKKRLQSSFLNACERQNLEVVQWLMQKTNMEYDLNKGLELAAEGLNLPLVEFLINKGSTNYSDALVVASYHGHTSLVKYCLPKNVTSVEKALGLAVKNERMEVIGMLLESGGVSLACGIRITAKYDKVSIFKWMLERSPDKNLALNFGMVVSLYYGSENISLLCVVMGADRWDVAIGTVTVAPEPFPDQVQASWEEHKVIHQRMIERGETQIRIWRWKTSEINL